jgi:hypothetical protein
MRKFQTWLTESYSPSHVFHGDPVLDAPRQYNPRYQNGQQTMLQTPKTQAGNSDQTAIHPASRFEAIESQLKSIQQMLGELLQRQTAGR